MKPGEPVWYTGRCSAVPRVAPAVVVQGGWGTWGNGWGGGYGGNGNGVRVMVWVMGTGNGYGYGYGYG